jgi:uncharacterized membrane protein
MRRAIDFLIELMQFCGVGVAFIGVVIAVVRMTLASLTGDGSKRVTTIRLDLARTVLTGIDLLLASATLQAAIVVREANFIRLAAVAGIRIALSLLISFEVAFQADTALEHAGDPRSRTAPPWGNAVRRHLRTAAARRPDARTKTRARPRHLRPTTRSAAAERQAQNIWADRARLGRD